MQLGSDSIVAQLAKPALVEEYQIMMDPLVLGILRMARENAANGPFGAANARSRIPRHAIL